MDAVKTGRVLKNLEMMLQCENAVTAFYQTCAKAWPRERVFWSDLAAGSLLRYTRLQLMQPRAENSESAADSIRVFHPGALTTFRAWVESSRVRVHSGEIGMRGGLALARDLERSPIVNEQYLVTRRTDPELADYLLSFATDYGEQTKRIEARLGESFATAKVA